jgi:(p)ppGpp synthase/HD superfamily hydrolase
VEIKDVIRFMTNDHGDQKYGDLPFCVHPMQVARHFTYDKLKTIALLHDVVEDTSWDIIEIENIFGKEISDAVDAITRRENEKYLEEYIPRVYKNELARSVKIADLEENIHSAKYCYPEYENLIKRYEKALEILKFYSFEGNISQ